MAWRKGMLAVCAYGGVWDVQPGGRLGSAPQKGEVCRVTWVGDGRPHNDSEYLMLEGYGDRFLSSCFRPAQFTGMQTLRSIAADPTRELERA